MSTIRTFMFHDIRDLKDTKYPERYKLKSFLNKSQFEYQIDYICNKYKVIRSDEIFNIDLSKGNTDYAILTFDDGLRDHYYVYEYLTKKKISGTFLVPSMPIEENKVMNTHKIQFVLASKDKNILSKEILSNFENKKDIWEKYSKTKWKNNWWCEDMIFITNILRKNRTDNFNYNYTNFLFEKYVSKDEENFAKDLYLNKDHINEMSNNNMIIGGHGYISENLLLIDDVETEIMKSKEFIRNYNNGFIFSYPNGGFNDDIKSIMKKYKCDLSFTVNPMTITDLDDVDYLELPRYDSPQKINLPL